METCQSWIKRQSFTVSDLQLLDNVYFLKSSISKWQKHKIRKLVIMNNLLPNVYSERSSYILK